MKTHHYQLILRWTGNTGQGTAGYRSYERQHEIVVEGKPVIYASSDPAFRGDRTKHNPEELFVAALSSCHMLWYLHLCAVNNIQVMEYVDRAEGSMQEKQDGSGQFTEVLLKPSIVITLGSDLEKAKRLHHEANAMCFIANSCNFPVRHVPEVKVRAMNG